MNSVWELNSESPKMSRDGSTLRDHIVVDPC